MTDQATLQEIHKTIKEFLTLHEQHQATYAYLISLLDDDQKKFLAIGKSSIYIAPVLIKRFKAITNMLENKSTKNAGYCDEYNYQFAKRAIKVKLIENNNLVKFSGPRAGTSVLAQEKIKEQCSLIVIEALEKINAARALCGLKPRKLQLQEIADIINSKLGAQVTEAAVTKHLHDLYVNQLAL